MSIYIPFLYNIYYHVRELNLLCEKDRTVTENQSIEPICCGNGPQKSGFWFTCSFNQMTNPVARLIDAIRIHIFKVNTFRTMSLVFVKSGFTVTTITSPDSIYGCVKSAISYRSAIISVSPTAASKLFFFFFFFFRRIDYQ